MVTSQMLFITKTDVLIQVLSDDSGDGCVPRINRPILYENRSLVTRLISKTVRKSHPLNCKKETKQKLELILASGIGINVQLWCISWHM